MTTVVWLKGYVVARNVTGRPTLMHRLGPNEHTTACGATMAGWSRGYTAAPIPAIMCKRCVA